MTRIFDITPASDILNIDSSGQGKLLFTVTNTTGRPQRASLRLRALDSGQSSWLKLNGDMERDFTAGFTHQVEVAVAPPSGAPPGRFRVRLDALSVANPDDDFTEGPAVGIVVPPIDAGVVVYLLMRKPTPEAQKPTTTNSVRRARLHQVREHYVHIETEIRRQRRPAAEQARARSTEAAMSH